MTETEKQKINVLYTKGYGYKAIAKLLSIAENTVKSYLRRHKGDIQVPVEDFKDGNLHFCDCCGAPLEQMPGRKPRRFCSDACRVAWWNKHPEAVKRKAYYQGVCNHCGVSFTAHKII